MTPGRRVRRILITGVCMTGLTALATGTSARADLPVIDVAALVEWAKSEANAAKAYALQYQQYVTQTQQYLTEVQMFVNWVHYPSLGAAVGLLNAAGLSSYLPVNALSLLGVINGLQSASGGTLSLGGLSGILGTLSNLANQAWTTNHVYTPTDGSWDSQQLNASAASIAGTQGTALAAYTDLQRHLAAQPALREQLLGSSSPKDVQDAAAEVALEQAWTANQQAQLTATQITYEAQRDSREQRDNEAISLSIDAWFAQSGTGLR